MRDDIVVFPSLAEVEAWHQCPGRYRRVLDGYGATVSLYIPGSACGFRAPSSDRAWIKRMTGEKGCPCGAVTPPIPVACNWLVLCDPSCEWHACTLSGCVVLARDQGRCRGGCRAVLRELIDETDRYHLQRWAPGLRFATPSGRP